MSRFYFDIDDGLSHSRDDEGVELPDVRAVRWEAIRVLPSIARDELPNGDNHDFGVSVRDQSGDVVFRASLKLRSEFVGG